MNKLDRIWRVYGISIRVNTEFKSILLEYDNYFANPVIDGLNTTW